MSDEISIPGLLAVEAFLLIVLCIVSIIAACSFGCTQACWTSSSCTGLPFEQNNNGPVNITSPVTTVPTVHPGMQTVTQPMTQPMNPMGGQLIQMPNGQLFILPSNSYPMAQP